MKVKQFAKQMESKVDIFPKTEREFVIAYVLIRAAHVDRLSGDAAARSAREAWVEIEKCKS